jgi:hypothetical protein
MYGNCTGLLSSLEASARVSVSAPVEGAIVFRVSAIVTSSTFPVDSFSSTSVISASYPPYFAADLLGLGQRITPFVPDATSVAGFVDAHQAYLIFLICRTPLVASVFMVYQLLNTTSFPLQLGHISSV